MPCRCRDCTAATTSAASVCATSRRLAKRASSPGRLTLPELIQAAGGFAAFTDPQALLRAERQALKNLAEELEKAGCQGLAWLLRHPAQEDQSLIIVAVRYFFRVAIAADDRLRNFLTFAHVDRLNRTQEEAFQKLDQVLVEHGDRLTEALDEVTETVALLRDSVLDLREELQSQVAQLGRHLDSQVQVLGVQVLQMLEQLHVQGRPVRPSDSLSLRSDSERELVRTLLRRYRGLPEEQRRAAPALLNGLGKLQLAAGDFAEAQDSFTQVASLIPDVAGRAEAHHNAYRAALERGDLGRALEELKAALTLDPAQFAPFPPDDYVPERILGAGGFGVTFLCRLRFSGALVAVKALAVDGLARDVEAVMQEAATLDQLSHPGIVRLRHGGYADLARTRPYLVMEFFDGQTLEQHVRRHGALSVPLALELARQVADALRAAHGKGILHRDVKPANVLLRCNPGERWSEAPRTCEARLIDFGLALKQDLLGNALLAGGKTVVSSSIAGTLEYAAPEQLGKLPGARVGSPADVYGFARTLCFALFESPEPTYQDWRKIPTALAELLDECLARIPERRPADFDSVLVRLAQVERSLSLSTEKRDQPPPLVAPPVSPPIALPVETPPAAGGSFLDLIFQAEQRLAADKVESATRQYDELRRELAGALAQLDLVEAYRVVSEVLRLKPDDADVLAVRAYLDERKVPSPAQSTEQLLLPVLRGFLPQDDLHVAPDIPEKKLANARKACEIPEAERILALVDATVFGSAKNCLAFGTEGLYFHNDWSSRTAGAGTVPYGEFAERIFARESWAEVGLGQGQFFNRSGSQVTSQKVVEILLAIRNSLARH
jgi:serine/threonine protein kinase